MSTKIYNGFKFNTKSITDIIEQLYNLKKEVKDIVRNDMKEMINDKLVLFHDYQKLNKTFTMFDYNSDCFIEVKTKDEMKKIIKMGFKTMSCSLEQDMNGFDDYKFEISIFQIKNAILGCPFVNASCLRDIIKEQSFYIEYGYWNNSDEPEGMSKREWNKREKDWEEATKIGHTFADNSLLYTLSPNIMNVFNEIFWTTHMFEDIVFESVEERAKRYAKDELMDKLYEEREDKNKTYSAIMNIDEEIESGKFNKEIAQRIKEIKKLIK